MSALTRKVILGSNVLQYLDTPESMEFERRCRYKQKEMKNAIYFDTHHFFAIGKKRPEDKPGQDWVLHQNQAEAIKYKTKLWVSAPLTGAEVKFREGLLTADSLTVISELLGEAPSTFTEQHSIDFINKNNITKFDVFWASQYRKPIKTYFDLRVHIISQNVRQPFIEWNGFLIKRQDVIEQIAKCPALAKDVEREL